MASMSNLPNRLRPTNGHERRVFMITGMTRFHSMRSSELLVRRKGLSIAAMGSPTQLQRFSRGGSSNPHSRPLIGRSADVGILHEPLQPYAEDVPTRTRL